MTEMDRRVAPWGGPRPLAVCFGVIAVLVHLLTNGRYGYFRDELYFLDCGQHLAWGYVDQPPLIGFVARVSEVLFGTSLQAIRVLPALAAGVKVCLTGLMAIALGGRRTAVALACLPVLVAPGFLVADSRLSMNAFEPLFWMGSAYALMLTIQRRQPQLLLWVGLLLGLGFENKHSAVFFCLALAVGLALSRERSLYRSPWLWAAAGLGLAVALPNLLWEFQHGWPTLEFLQNVKRSQRDVDVAPAAFVWKQFGMLQPISALVWLPGLWFYLAGPAGARFRALGWAYLLVFASMLLLKGKDYYVLPAYPMLFAAGGAFWELALQKEPRWRWLSFAFLALLGLGGFLRAPFAVPVLPVETFLRYQRALGVQPRNADPHQTGQLPQHFGDEFGWEEMVETVASLYQTLSPTEQKQTTILARNYGEAGAIDFFGPRYGLPRAISGHQSYFLWGPGPQPGALVILLQWDRQSAADMCQRVEEGPMVDVPHSMDEERYQILICRSTREPLSQMWMRLKRWN